MQDTISHFFIVNGFWIAENYNNISTQMKKFIQFFKQPGSCQGNSKSDKYESLPDIGDSMLIQSQVC